MKAVRVISPSTIEIVDVPAPAAGGQVLLRCKTIGVCGTDVKVFTGAIPVDYPRVLGHEMIGEVIQAPDGTGLRPGDRVLVDPASACGFCDLCRRGRGHLCRNAGLMGREIDGVFSELVSVPASQVLPVPESIRHEREVAAVRRPGRVFVSSH